MWRVKGFTQIESKPVLVQFTMGQLEIVDVQPRESYHMVFIGHNMDHTGISKAFSFAMNSENL